jgi:glutamine amidotransferase
MLDSLRVAFPTGRPPLADLVELLAHLTVELSCDGTFNYLLSNGEYLFAHCSDRLCYVVRQAPFTTAHLVDEDVEVDFSQVTTPTDRVAVIATLPLTDNERWSPLAPGELAVFADGRRIQVE